MENNGRFVKKILKEWQTFRTRSGTKLYRQVQGVPMGTHCASLVADLVLFCYERDIKMSLSDDKQAYAINAFNNTSRYLDVILNINNIILTNGKSCTL